MNKPLLGLLLGAVLGGIDGSFAPVWEPDDPVVREGIVGIIVGSTFKGLVAGLATGFFAYYWIVRAPARFGPVFPRDVPRPLRSVCLKALAFERDDRYRTAEDLAAEVARFLGGHAVGAHREGVLERLGRLGTKYRTLILVVSAYLLVRVLLFFVGGR